MQILRDIRMSLILCICACLSLPLHSVAQEQKAAQERGFDIAKNLEIFTDVYKNLNLYYVDDVEPGKVMKTAIDAMLASLDPYTNYYPESDIENVKLQLMGEYGGIGSLIHQKGDSIYIAQPYEGFPAQKAGLKAGDRIVSLGGESATGKSVNEVSERLRGQAGTTIDVELERNGKILKKTLKREVVKLPNMPYSGFIKGTDVGYIKLIEFTQKSGSNVREAFEKMRKERPQMSGFILDLRNNGGGLMNEAVDLVNIFVKRGEMIVETKGKITARNSKSFTTNTPVDLQIPIVVLVNGNSASSSEIVSGSLQDLDRAVIMGNRTLGKGLVQNVLPMDYNTQMKITVAKYYIPSGRCVQAIDYSHRDKNGRAVKVPDSLKTAFQTRNGRTVYDGFGIEPDVETKVDYMSMLGITLLNRQLIFDYATKFEREHPSIPPAEDFEITDEIYNDFKQYLATQTYEYNTATELILKEMQKVAKEEGCIESIATEMTQLEEQLKRDKANDLDKYRDEISEMLKSEILVRYYYEKGAIQGSLVSDPEIQEALKLLADRDRYNKILNK